MKQIPINQKSWLQAGTDRVARIHFLYVLVLVIQILVYDAWKLITPVAVMQRWIITAILLFVTTAVWYLSRNIVSSTNAYKILVLFLILTDITVATFGVYTQRGMASRAVALYAIPIITATVLRSRRALYATAILSIGAYVTAALSYFVNYFNEGYKIELYGEIGFYSAIFFILALLLWAVLRSKKNQ